MSKNNINDYNDYWIEIGRRSFARFFNMSIGDVDKMAENSNGVFLEMLLEIKMSLSQYEDFMVKIKRVENRKEKITRLDLLDL